VWVGFLSSQLRSKFNCDCLGFSSFRFSSKHRIQRVLCIVRPHLLMCCSLSLSRASSRPLNTYCRSLECVEPYIHDTYSLLLNCIARCLGRFIVPEGACLTQLVQRLGYGLDDRVSIPARGRKGIFFFLFATALIPVLGPTEPPIQWVLGREVYHSSPFSAEVKNAWSYNFPSHTSSGRGT
jgi:hypothetical protein